MEVIEWLYDKSSYPVLVACAYICFRLAKYGRDKADRVILWGLSVIFVLIIPVSIFRASHELFSVILIIVGVLLFFMLWLAGVPGLKVDFRKKVIIELFVVGVLGIVLSSLMK